MNDEITIFGIAGSIRRDSYNLAALRAAQELMPAGVKLDIFEDLAAVPPYNPDTEFMPEPVVVDLKARIRNCAGVLIATPEYNYGMPGVLKNAIDQASRPVGDNAWDGKPAAIISVSSEPTGAARAQDQLHQAFVYLNVHLVDHSDVMITNAGDHFEDGRLTNGKVRSQLSDTLTLLVERAVEYERNTHEMPFPGFRPRGVAPRKS